jgi:HAD superfamily hydrolase (TIGR01544 family)
MVKNVIIPDPYRLERIMEEISKSGAGNLCVVSDFDLTLTKAFVEGRKSESVFSQIRNADHLGSYFSRRERELYDKYHPIEIDPYIETSTKSREMDSWWREYFGLLVEHGFDRNIMGRIVKERTLTFREGALEFMDILCKKEIPLVIFSAGPGDMIAEYLRQEGMIDENVHLIANFLIFDDSGKAVGIREPMIHSLNKHEIEVRRLPLYEETDHRKNVILLGDLVEDIGMAYGFEFENIMKIGFFNYDEEKSIGRYKENFDVVITKDSGMNFVNDFIRKIV